MQENAAPRGRPNLTFCQWVNNELLTNTVLDPRSVSVETARKWLHELGFDVLQMSKGVFIDGHERPAVVESREKFIRKMTECGFLRPDNAPHRGSCPSTTYPHMTKEEGEKCIVWWHDESACNTSEDTPILLGGERKTTDQAEGKRFIDYGFRVHRGEGWLPGTQ